MGMRRFSPIFCAGCVLSGLYPDKCLNDCPNLVGETNKFAPLLANYWLIMAARNQPKEEKEHNGSK
jgi:hypothetical protein